MWQTIRSKIARGLHYVYSQSIYAQKPSDKYGRPLTITEAGCGHKEKAYGHCDTPGCQNRLQDCPMCNIRLLTRLSSIGGPPTFCEVQSDGWCVTHGRPVNSECGYGK